MVIRSCSSFISDAALKYPEQKLGLGMGVGGERNKMGRGGGSRENVGWSWLLKWTGDRLVSRLKKCKTAQVDSGLSAPTPCCCQPKILTREFKATTLIGEAECDILRVAGDRNDLRPPLVGLNLAGTVDRGRVLI